MIGNIFTSDSIAEELKRNLENAKARKKNINQVSESPSYEGASHTKLAELNPEDFLIEESEPDDVYGRELDNKIEEVSSYAKDDLAKNNEAKDSWADDISYLVDKKAQYVLGRLGKIAKKMRDSGKSYAADLIEVAAVKIKDDAVKKASKKLTVVNNLQKMATRAYHDGDNIVGDIISVTIDSIKNENGK